MSYQGNAFYPADAGRRSQSCSAYISIQALIRSCSVENDDRWVMFDQLTALAIDEPHSEAS